MNIFFIYFNTHSDDIRKYDNVQMLSGDRDAIWAIWYTLTQVNNYPNVTVRDMAGKLIDCTKGFAEMQIYDPSCFI